MILPRIKSIFRLAGQYQSVLLPALFIAVNPLGGDDNDYGYYSSRTQEAKTEHSQVKDSRSPKVVLTQGGMGSFHAARAVEQIGAYSGSTSNSGVINEAAFMDSEVSLFDDQLSRLTNLYLMRARNMISQGDSVSVIRDELKKVLMLSPSNPEALRMLAEINKDKEMVQEVQAPVSAVSTKKSEQKIQVADFQDKKAVLVAEGAYEEAKTLLREKKFLPALERFKFVKETAPESEYAKFANEYILVLRERIRAEEAKLLESLKPISEKEETVVRAVKTSDADEKRKVLLQKTEDVLASVKYFYEKGNLERAAANLQMLLGLEPNHREAQELLGKVSEELRLKKEAAEAIREAEIRAEKKKHEAKLARQLAFKKKIIKRHKEWRRIADDAVKSLFREKTSHYTRKAEYALERGDLFQVKKELDMLKLLGEESAQVVTIRRELKDRVAALNEFVGIDAKEKNKKDSTQVQVCNKSNSSSNDEATNKKDPALKQGESGSGSIEIKGTEEQQVVQQAAGGLFASLSNYKAFTVLNSCQDNDKAEMKQEPKKSAEKKVASVKKPSLQQVLADKENQAKKKDEKDKSEHAEKINEIKNDIPGEKERVRVLKDTEIKEAEKYYGRAQKHLRQGNDTLALVALKQVVQYDPNGVYFPEARKQLKGILKSLEVKN